MLRCVEFDVSPDGQVFEFFGLGVVAGGFQADHFAGVVFEIVLAYQAFESWVNKESFKLNSDTIRQATKTQKNVAKHTKNPDHKKGPKPQIKPSKNTQKIAKKPHLTRSLLQRTCSSKTGFSSRSC